MKNLRALTLTIIFVFSQSVFADEKSIAIAESLLEALNFDATLHNSLDQVIESRIKENPSIAPYKTTMLDFFTKYASYESLKPQIIDLYTKTYTLSELVDMDNFYRTSAGKKSLKMFPLLMDEIQLIAEQQIVDNSQELEDMVRAEAKRLRGAQAESSN